MHFFIWFEKALLIFSTLNQDHVMEDHADGWHMTKNTHVEEDHVVGQYMTWDFTEDHINGWHVIRIITAKDHGDGYHVTDITMVQQ